MPLSAGLGCGVSDVPSTSLTPEPGPTCDPNDLILDTRIIIEVPDAPDDCGIEVVISGANGSWEADCLQPKCGCVLPRQTLTLEGAGGAPLDEVDNTLSLKVTSRERTVFLFGGFELQDVLDEDGVSCLVPLITIPYTWGD